MIFTAALVLLIGGSSLLPPPPPAVVVVPDEPDAVMLPEAPTYRAVVADVDGDGARDVVRTVATPDEAIEIEAWHFVVGLAGWQELADPVIAIPSRASSEPGQLVYADAPARLIVRRIDGEERVTLARQPRFEEPGLEVDCCLVLHDLVVQDGELRLVEVSERLPDADAVLALDMDGDATDELLVTRGLRPLGDTTFPTDARILRWSTDRFAPPVLSELLVGSGFSPFILGDTDGLPGDEAAFIGAQSRLHRLSLRDGDALVAESSAAAMLGAVAVPLIGEGRGIATLSGLSGLEVRAWPRDAPPGPSLGTRSMREGFLFGVTVANGGVPVLAVGSEGSIIVLGLPDLRSISTLAPSPAAARLATGPLRAFAGLLPGGDTNGDAALFVGGGLLPGIGEVASTVTLAGTVPIGLAGPERGWLVLWHGASASLDPAGGRLDPPIAEAGSGVSVVRSGAIFIAELEGGRLEPTLDTVVAEDGDLLVSGDGFGASIVAPPGSRVYVQVGATEPRRVEVVPAGGNLRVAVHPPSDGPAEVAIAVVTPGGRAYAADWLVAVLDGPPALDVRAETSVGSPSVLIAGQAAAQTGVRIGNRVVTVDAEGGFSAQVELPPWPTEVEVVATDRVGNESRVTVVGVGWFDYRALPWTAIVIAAVAVAGGFLALRAPRVREEARPADEDGTLEELDPEC